MLIKVAHLFDVYIVSVLYGVCTSIWTWWAIQNLQTRNQMRHIGFARIVSFSLMNTARNVTFRCALFVAWPVCCVWKHVCKVYRQYRVRIRCVFNRILRLQCGSHYMKWQIEKMAEYCSTGQSPQRAVVLMEEVTIWNKSEHTVC